MNNTLFGDLNLILIQTLSGTNLVTLLLNCCIIWLMFTGTKRTVESDIFSLNLALSESLFCLNILWLIAVIHTRMGQLLCPYLFSLGFLFTARPLFQTCICVDYYLGVVHPVVFLKYKPLRYRVVFCCVAWLFILASCLCCMLYFTKFPFHYSLFIQNFFFMACVVYCCLWVLKTLKKPGPSENTANKNKSNKSKQKAFDIICLIFVSMTINFILSVAPIPLQTLISPFRYMEVMTVCIALSLASGILQPLLYLHRTDRLTCFKRT